MKRLEQASRVLLGEIDARIVLTSEKCVHVESVWLVRAQVVPYVALDTFFLPAILATFVAEWDWFCLNAQLVDVTDYI